jgi:hypothetical protein
VIAVDTTSVTIQAEPGRQVIVPLHKLGSEKFEIITRK